MAERIPKEVLIRARLAMKRRVAAVVLMAMAADDGDFAIIDKRCEWKAGTARKWLDSMIDGTGKDLDEVSDLAVALDVEMHFQMHRRPTASLPETP